MTLETMVRKAKTTARNVALVGSMALASIGLGRDAAAEEYVIPAVAEAPGAAGSYWDTTVELSNLTDALNRVDVTFYTSNKGPVGTTSVTLQPRETYTLSKVQSSMGLEGRTGALKLSTEGPIAAGARIFNDTGDGTLGQGFPVIPVDDLYDYEITMLFLTNDSGAYRTNLGHYQEKEGYVMFELQDNFGNKKAAMEPFFADNEHRQYSIEQLFQTTIGDNYRVIITNEGTGYSYASQVDNTTNDPTTKTPHAIGFRNRPPTLHGLDYFNNGIVDNGDEDGNGIINATVISPRVGEKKFWLICSDPDNDPLTFTGQSLPANMGLNQDTGEITFAPMQNQVGNTYFPTFTCRDNRGGFNSLDVPFKVVE